LKRVLVIALAGIGDALIATSFLRELRRQLPGAEIDILVRWRGAADLLKGNPGVTNVRCHDFGSGGMQASLRMLRSLAARRYDVSFTLHPQGRREYRIITRLIGARRRITHAYENASWIDRLLVTDCLPQDYTVHSSENNARLLPLAGLEHGASDQGYVLNLTPEETGWARDWVAARGLVGRPWIGVAAGSGGTKNLALRRWSPRRYEELVRRLAEIRPETPLVFFGGPEERELHGRFRTNLGGLFIEAATPSLRHAAALVAEGPVFLSSDGVFMHLAAAGRVRHQFLIESPAFNPPMAPRRPDYILIENPAVHGRNLEYYRYDGRNLKGTPEELVRIMETVTVDDVLRHLLPILAT
jgi:ADP-heptose:LPS heptosyltransferase